MPKKKKEEVAVEAPKEEVKVEAPAVEAPVEEAKDTPIVEGVTKHTLESYTALIEGYKTQNPKKYEQKKAEFERKLKALK